MSSDPSNWTPLGFSRYKGKTLPQAVLDDPDWVYYMHGREIFTGAHAVEASQVCERGRHIRIPTRTGMPMEAEYFIHPPTRKLHHVNVVPADQHPHQGSSRGSRTNTLDLGLAREVANGRDKTGSKRIAGKVKEVYFGKGKSATRERCEDFFDNLDNFALPPEPQVEASIRAADHIRVLQEAGM
jgi:hypothetical protein